MDKYNKPKLIDKHLFKKISNYNLTHKKYISYQILDFFKQHFIIIIVLLLITYFLYYRYKNNKTNQQPIQQHNIQQPHIQQPHIQQPHIQQYINQQPHIQQQQYINQQPHIQQQPQQHQQQQPQYYTPKIIDDRTLEQTRFIPETEQYSVPTNQIDPINLNQNIFNEKPYINSTDNNQFNKEYVGHNFSPLI